MEFRQSLELGVTPEQQRENYEQNASASARARNTFFEKLLGKGLTKEDILIVDAKKEDKYRSLLKEGKINEEELKFLIKNDIKVSDKSNFVSHRKYVVEGMINGNKIMLVQDGDTSGDNRIVYSYTANVNGEDVELSEKEGDILYDELIVIIKKRRAILEKITKDEVSGLVGE